MTLFAALLFDAAVCFGGARIFAQPNEWVVAGLFLTMGLWAVQVLVRLKSALFKIFIYYFGDKKHRIAKLVGQFHKFDMPAYDDLQFSGVEEYLERVSLSEDATARARTFAGANLGILISLRDHSVIETLQGLSVMELAAEKYAQERRRDGWRLLD